MSNDIAKIFIYVSSAVVILISAVYYFMLIVGDPNIYITNFIGISSFVLSCIAAIRLYLYPESRKKILVFISVLFVILSIFYLTDNVPIITFEIAPANANSIRDMKVSIFGVDDRCLSGPITSTIVGIQSTVISDLKAFSWLPVYCHKKTYNRVLEIKDIVDKMSLSEFKQLREIVIQLTLRDSVGHTVTKYIAIPIPASDNSENIIK